MGHSLTNRSRRDFIKTTAAACSSLFLPGAANVLAKENTLRLGYLPITDATPLLVAHGLGYFSQEGLHVERPVMVRSWKILVESFLAGRFNFTHMLFPIPVWMRFKQKVPVKVLAWDHTNGSAITVRQDSEIHTFKDLGGRQIAVPSWYSMHNLILQMGIRSQGLRPVIKPQSEKLSADEVNLFILPPPDMPNALLGRKIDGYIVADPFNALAQIKFNARIMRFTGDIWKNHPCCVIVAHENFINQNSVIVQKAVNAIVRAQDWCNKNPSETAHLLCRDGEGYLPFPRHVLSKVFEKPLNTELVHPDWDVERIGFQPFPFPSATRFIIDQMKQTVVEGDSMFLKKLDTPKSADQLVDHSFVSKAIADMGGLNRFCNCDITQPYTREEVVEIS
ncbi:MAG: ABC transporter substrate-binding protein [Proteobacteria bacterium]|nr:ABC transporter substrate-binding protein [Pseudomonadota bacterium]MBU1389315.1 ABC transporter substrate-binding protein [Pseudomonadota bacterium]MBU1544135.1 ABC transporter substrate-binding protein [Pseudomonadota bacterium]MBU2431647.1 ABC transporter substrate-binding protein [Pseudomonadota bacterium]MBU2482728.1 ABC transporter substrate-binding protein [Pseudomonadota bacterium]